MVAKWHITWGRLAVVLEIIKLKYMTKVDFTNWLHSELDAVFNREQTPEQMMLKAIPMIHELSSQNNGKRVLPAVVFYLDNFTDVKFIGYNENFVHKFLEMDDQCSEEQLELLQFGGKVIDEDGEHTSGTYYLSMSKVESFSFYNGI